jgi:hypothetical protein
MVTPNTESKSSGSSDLSAYCKRCGYSLRGLEGGKCPECGREFDLSDRRSFARRPPRPWVLKWTRRVLLLVLCLSLGVASVPGWYWWRWHSEQKLIEQLKRTGGRILVKRYPAQGLENYLPERWAFLRDHAYDVRVHRLSAEQMDGINVRWLSQVEWLEFWDCHVDDKVLAQFAGFKKLEHLNVFENPLNGSGFEHAACGGLSSLDLRGTHVNDGALAHLAKLTSLRTLDLRFTGVTDAGMEEVAKLPSLKLLDLEGTAVSDAGLLKLRGMSSLRWIRVEHTKITREGMAKLKAALPTVIFFGPLSQ